MSALYWWNVSSLEVGDNKKLLGGKAIVDQQLKITFRKSSAPPWKNQLPSFYLLPAPLKIQKV